MSSNSKKISRLWNGAERAYSVFGRHPFLLCFLAVVLLTPLCFGAQGNITDSSKMIWCLIGLSAPVSVFFVYFRIGLLDKKSTLICMGLSFVCWIFICRGFVNSQRASLWIFAGMAASVLSYRYIMLDDKERAEKHNAFTIMALSFSMKFCYVLYTSCYTRQNDVGSFDKDSGHAAYIEYLIQNKHLPDFLPTERWQFYHPPLHHTVSACWIDFCENVLGASRNHARESLQMLMLFYSAAAVVIVYKLLRYFGFSGKSLLLPLALFAFHPAYILSSGAINNDQLAALMTVLTMLLTVRWFEHPDTKHIIPIALSIGFGMMAKLNAGTIAPAVALLFLWQLIIHKNEIRTFIWQYVIFGVICVPLGLWWQIRNKIMWGMSFDYVPFVGGDQAIDMGIFERLFDFSPKQLSPVFENWIRDGRDFTEYNPNIAIMKNSLFGESIKENNFPAENTIVPTVLFWVAVVLAVTAVAAMIYFMFRKDTKMLLPHKVLFCVYWTFTMYYFYVFCYTYSATCTMNFRYLTPLLVVSTMQFAMLFDHLGTKREGESEGRAAAKLYVGRIFTGLIALFCVLSVVTYLMVGYTEVK